LVEDGKNTNSPGELHLYQYKYKCRKEFTWIAPYKMASCAPSPDAHCDGEEGKDKDRSRGNGVEIFVPRTSVTWQWS